MADLPGVRTDAMSSAVRDAIRPVADAIKSVTDAMRAAVPGFEKLYQFFRQFGDWVKSNTQTLADLGGRLLKVAEAFGAVASVAPKVAAAAGVLGSLISGLVGKANPAVAQQFTLALNDTLAVIGQALVPVLRVLTRLMRSFGDTLQSFAGGVGEALASILDSLMPLFQVFLDVFARAGELVAGVLQFVAPLVKIAAEGIRTVFEWIGKAVRYLLDLIGVEVSESGVRPGSSVGAAVRQAGVSSVSGVIQQAQISALQLGNASADYAKQTASYTFKMSATMDDILKTLRNPLRIIDVLEEAKRVKEESRRMALDLAPGGYYADQLRAAQAQRALADLALRTGGFGRIYKSSLLDSGGTVPGGPG